MILLIDMGNSRIKWAILREGVIVSSLSQSYAEDEGNFDWLSHISEPPISIYVASVARESVCSHFIDTCHDRWGVIPVIVHTQKYCAGVTNGYMEANTLGIDRWAAIIGAYHLVGGAVLVIDCGTACSADLVDANGKHLGGAIVPGREMMQQSLFRGTAGVRGVTSSELSDVPGSTTLQCIQLGVTEALTGFVDRMNSLAVAHMGTQTTVVITGGDAPLLLPFLSTNIRYEKNLVFLGMLTMVAEQQGRVVS